MKQKQVLFGTLSLIALTYGIQGCATNSANSIAMTEAGFTTLSSVSGSRLQASTRDGVESISTASLVVPTKSKFGRDEGTEQENEFYDPFQQPGEEPQGLEEYDPWERFNRRIFNVNRKLDQYALKPGAEVHDKIIPDTVERALSRVFHNAGFVPRFLNNLLQGKVKGAGIEFSRFALNTTFGIGGVFDFAKEVFQFNTPEEDTGQTLAVWGMKPGPYLQLPFFPPLTVRDGIGYAADGLLNPIYFFIPFTALVGTRAEYVVNERSLNLETFQGAEEATVDLYAAVRNAYLQKRARDILEGEATRALE